MESPAIDIAAIEKRLDEAIEYAEAQGYKLTPGVTLDHNKRECCPMGAYTFLHRFGPSLFPAEWAYRDLGLDMRCGFVPGFDGSAPDNEEHDPTLYALGQKYRARALRESR